MSFYEKSAWVMILTLLGTSGWYIYSVIDASAGNTLVTPSLGALVSLIVLQVVVIVIAHIVLAALKPKEATGSFDEREHQIAEKAGQTGGIVLNAGVIVSLGAYLVLESGDLLFYSVLLSVYAGALMQYAARVYLYRSALH